MLPPRLLAPLALATTFSLGCSSSGEPAKGPDGTPAAGATVVETAAPVDAAKPGTSVAPPVASADASAAPAGASSGTLSIAGKTLPLKAYELREEDGEYYFYAKAENEEGIALSLGRDVAEGAKIAKDRGVTGHVLEDGKIVNVGADASPMTFELTKKALGTWEKPGKCSGKFTAETKYKSNVIKASGTFEGASCWKL